MSYPSFVAAGTFQNGIGALTVPQPTGIQNGDLLMLFVETANEVVTTPTGYTIAPSSPQGTGTAGAAGGTRLSVFYKIAGTSEGSVSVADSGDHQDAVILAFRNVDDLNPFNTSSGGVQATAATSLTLPSVTTSRSQCMIVNAVGTDNDLNTTANFSAWANEIGRAHV